MLPSASNIKSFSWSLEQIFLTVGHNNFGNKIPWRHFFIKHHGAHRKLQLRNLKKWQSAIFFPLTTSEFFLSQRNSMTELTIDSIYLNVSLDSSVEYIWIHLLRCNLSRLKKCLSASMNLVGGHLASGKKIHIFVKTLL